MSFRRALPAALALSLCTAGLASAAVKKPAVKPVCNLVVDDAGDADAGLLTVASEPSWDVKSADVFSDGKTLTTAIRVTKLAKSTNNQPLGSQWRLDFNVGAVKLYLQAMSSPFGDKFSFGYVDSTSHGYAAGTANGVFDLAKNEVRIWAPVSAASAQVPIKAKTVLSALVASAGDYVNTAGGSPSGSFRADEATGTKTYAVTTPSCVPNGK